MSKAIRAVRTRTDSVEPVDKIVDKTDDVKHRKTDTEETIEELFRKFIALDNLIDSVRDTEFSTLDKDELLRTYIIIRQSIGKFSRIVNNLRAKVYKRVLLTYIEDWSNILSKIEGQIDELI